MATLLQSNRGGSVSGPVSGSSLTTSAAGFSSATTSGSLLVLVVRATISPFAGAPATGTPVTSGGYSKVWTFAGAIASFGNASDNGAGTVKIYYISNAPSMSPSQVTTVSVSSLGTGTMNGEFELYEFGGVTGLVPDKNANSSGQLSGTPHVSFSPATTNVDLIITAHISPTSGSNIAAGSGYTLGINAQLAIYSQTQYNLSASVGQSLSSFLGTEPNYWGCCAVGFTTTAVPVDTITSVTPNVGPTTGGTLVTILGTNFGAGYTVTFGGVAATNVVVVNSNTITCTTPAHSVGYVDVSVIDTNSQAVTLVNGYAYEQQGIFRYDGWLYTAAGPVIVSADVWVLSQPAVVPTGYQVVYQGGQQTVIGTLPSPLATIYADPNGIVPITQPLSTDGFGHYSFYASGHASGVTSLFDFYTIASYTTAGSQVSGSKLATLFQTLQDQYLGQFSMPDITSISPTTGPAATVVSINGFNFQAGATVQFGSAFALNVSIVSSTLITCLAPSGSGVVTVTVQNTDGQTGVLTNAFTYL